MSFTYDPAQLKDSPLYQTRFRLGDTVEDTATFQDEEIQYALDSNNNNVTNTCIDCITALLPRLAQKTEFSVGPYTEKGSSSMLDYWTKLLAELKSKNSIYAPPISLAPTTPPLFHYNMMSVDDNAEDPRRHL